LCIPIVSFLLCCGTVYAIFEPSGIYDTRWPPHFTLAKYKDMSGVAPCLDVVSEPRLNSVMIAGIIRSSIVHCGYLILSG
jgi:hypothetical protein